MPEISTYNPITSYKKDDLLYIVSDSISKKIQTQYAIPKINFAAALAPTVDDDTDEEYTIGSRWFDTTHNIYYNCFDNTNGAAHWRANVAWPVTNNITYGGKNNADLWFMHDDAGLESGGQNTFYGLESGNVGNMEWGWLGTLTTRTSDTEGVITIAAGHNFNTGVLATLIWNGGGASNVSVDGDHDDNNWITGTDISVSGTGYVLPAETTEIRIGQAHQNPAYSLGIGYHALHSLTRGMGNTAGGWNTGANITLGYRNSIWGCSSAYNLTTGYYNSTHGYAALFTCTTGYNNAAFGANSMYYLTTGYENVGCGINTLQWMTIGVRNTAVGMYAGNYNVVGEYNCYSGYECGYGYLGTSNSCNSFYGAKAGRNITTGGFNTFIGYSAGFNTTTASRQIIIGYNQDSIPFNTDDYLNIGGVLLGSMAGSVGTLYMPAGSSFSTTGSVAVYDLDIKGLATNVAAARFYGGASVGTPNVANGQILIGYSPISQLSLAYDILGIAYIDNVLDHADAKVKIRLRTAGTPVDACTINAGGYWGFGIADPLQRIDMIGPLQIRTPVSGNWISLYDSTNSEISYLVYLGARGDLRFYKYTATAGDVLILGSDGAVTLPIVDQNLLFGSTAAWQGRIYYKNAPGSWYFDNSYDDNGGNFYFRTKVAGTPINALILYGTGASEVNTITINGNLIHVGDYAGFFDQTPTAQPDHIADPYDCDDMTFAHSWDGATYPTQAEGDYIADDLGELKNAVDSLNNAVDIILEQLATLGLQADS